MFSRELSSCPDINRQLCNCTSGSVASDCPEPELATGPALVQQHAAAAYQSDYRSFSNTQIPLMEYCSEYCGMPPEICPGACKLSAPPLIHLPFAICHLPKLLSMHLHGDFCNLATICMTHWQPLQCSGRHADHVQAAAAPCCMHHSLLDLNPPGFEPFPHVAASWGYLRAAPDERVTHSCNHEKPIALVCLSKSKLITHH